MVGDGENPQWLLDYAQIVGPRIGRNVLDVSGKFVVASLLNSLPNRAVFEIVGSYSAALFGSRFFNNDEDGEEEPSLLRKNVSKFFDLIAGNPKLFFIVSALDHLSKGL